MSGAADLHTAIADVIHSAPTRIGSVRYDTFDKGGSMTRRIWICPSCDELLGAGQMRATADHYNSRSQVCQQERGAPVEHVAVPIGDTEQDWHTILEAMGFDVREGWRDAPHAGIYSVACGTKPIPDGKYLVVRPRKEAS